MIREALFELQDKEYAQFQAKLTPGVPLESFIGVRVPQARALAKRLMKENPEEVLCFLEELPHTYYDENMLHGLLLSEMKNYETCVQKVEAFLPYVDNWAVCDIMSPRVFRSHKDVFIDKIRNWSASKHTYTCRFGMEMLMSHYLDADFKSEYLEIPAAVVSDEYYINMMIAWFFATALAKQWDEAVKYLTEHRLGIWVHNKTIQKARESYRISPEQKTYLKTLKR